MSKIKNDASYKQKDDSGSDKTEQFAKIAAMQSLNDSLQSIGEPPIKKKRLGEGKYTTRKLKRTENAVKTKTHKSQKEIFETKQAVPKL
jgi:hypothetical protein